MKSVNTKSVNIVNFLQLVFTLLKYEQHIAITIHYGCFIKDRKSIYHKK